MTAKREVLALGVVVIAATAASGAWPATRAIPASPQRIVSGLTHGPGKRGFAAFVVDRRSSSTVYAGTGSGVFKSSDGGETWRSANRGLSDTDLFDLAADPQHPMTLYAATQTGLFKSADAAVSWQPTGLTRMNAIAVAVHPRRSAVVYVGQDRGVFKTSDGGEHWRKVARGRRVFALAIDPRQPRTVYAGTGRGVIKTIDGGATWMVMSRGLFIRETPGEVEHRLAEGFITSLAVDPRNPRTLYAGCDYGVFKSSDAAGTWKRVRNGLPHLKKYSQVGSLAVDPRQPQTLYAGNGRGVYKSANGGRSWTSLGLPQRDWTIAIGLDQRNPRTLYVGTTRGSRAYKSNDAGRQWQPLVVSGL